MSSDSAVVTDSTTMPITDDLMAADDDIPLLAQSSPRPIDFLEKTETAFEKRSRVFSLIISLSILAITEIQATMYWTSLWPYLETLDPGTSESFFGWILMVYSLVGAISSPFYGWWANRIHSTKVPIMAGLALSTCGNLLLAFVENFPTRWRKWGLMGARVVSGLGAGNQGALFAHVVMASKESERNRVLSIRGAILSASTMLGPGLQAAMVPIGYPGLVWGPMRLSMYTTPAFISCGLGLISLMVMACVFHESWLSVAEQRNGEGKLEQIQMRFYDTAALLVCGFGRFAQIFVLAFDDSIGSPLTMLMFRWTRSEAILYNGIINVTLAFFDLFAQLFVGNCVLNWVRERVLIVIGFLFMLGFFVIVFPWPGLPLLVGNHGNVTTLRNFSVHKMSSIDTDMVIPESIASNMTLPNCDFSWCSYTTRISLGQYLTASLLLVSSLSLTYTPTATLFSKLLGPRRQGTWQGFFASCDMLGLTVSPPIAANLFQHFGPRVMWSFGFALITGALVATASLFNRLIPWSENIVEEAAGEC